MNMCQRSQLTHARIEPVMELFRIRYRITVTVTDINDFEEAKNAVTDINDFGRARKITITDINDFGEAKKITVSNNRYRKYGNVRKRETVQIK